MDTDVIVVGYGPAGMAMTALLARAGHRVTVLERYDGLYNLPRAAIFDDETMRTLDKLGIAEVMLPKVHVQRNYEWRNAGGELLIEHHFAETGRSGWAEWYMMYQPELEEALDGACRRWPHVEIRHGQPVTFLTQDGAGVAVQTIDAAGVESTVTGRYVVACDGGNSFTRRQLGIGQEDYGFSEPWMVCDFRLNGTRTPPAALQVGDPAGPTSVIALGPRHHRFSFMLGSESEFESERDPDLVWKRVASYLKRDEAELIRIATYTFRSLIADRWRDGRILLAGDAAHQMPPFLGQGMCSGIRDAQNLAFKLDLILRDRAADGLLDTYQTEREPHVRAVVEKGIELGRLQTTRDPAAAAERDRRLLAQRATDTKPEKLVFPGLSNGLLSSAAAAGDGELFVQGFVTDGRQEGRFDSVVGRGFYLLLSPSAGDLLNLGETAALAEAAVGVVRFAWAVAADYRPGEVLDSTGLYHAWFAERGCTAVVVRPDFYVYGCAVDDDSVHRLVAELMADLGGTLAEHTARPLASAS